MYWTDRFKKTTSHSKRSSTHTHTHTLAFEYRVDKRTETTDGGHSYRGADYWQHDDRPVFGSGPVGERPSRQPPASHRSRFCIVHILGRIWATDTSTVPACRHSAALQSENFRLCKAGQLAYTQSSGRVRLQSPNCVRICSGYLFPVAKLSSKDAEVMTRLPLPLIG